MTTRIRLLEDHVINQIAAGEVVERPASVVKELVENAIDASAQNVDVFLKEGGMTLIRVRDDGVGMSRADALLCVRRHATSKISAAEDLTRVESLGFRGEALPSIASVSEFELITRRKEDAVGTQLRVLSGEVSEAKDAGSAVGTDIYVRNLFAQIPARRKFLRTRSTELAHCVEAVTREALIQPEIGFSLSHQGRDLFRVRGGQSWEQRMRALVREASKTSLLTVEREEGDLTVHALMGPPTSHKSSATGGLYLYVNGRYVRDPIVRRAVSAAYRERIPRGRFPLCLLHLQVPRNSVDVNVHPAKTEVRFYDPGRIMDFVSDALEQALGSRTSDQAYSHTDNFAHSEAKLPFNLGAEPVRRTSPSYHREPYTPSLPAHPDDDSGWTQSVRAPARSYGSSTPPSEPRGLPDTQPGSAPRYPSTTGDDEQTWTQERFVDILLGRFCLIELDSCIRLIDLREVSVRLAKKRLSLCREEFLGESRPLLVPLQVQLSGLAEPRLQSFLDEMSTFGFDLMAIQPGLVVVRRVPRVAADGDPVVWVEALFDAYMVKGAEDALEVELARLWAFSNDIDDTYAARALLAETVELGVDILKGVAVNIDAPSIHRLISRGEV